MSKWIAPALKAINLVFDNNGQVDRTKPDTEIEKAKKYFYKSLENSPTEAWPYIKLADLVTDTNEKTKLHIKALKIEENKYSIYYLFNQIIKDNPNILDKYLIQ